MIHRIRWYLVAFIVVFGLVITKDFKNYSVPHKPLLASNVVVPYVAKNQTPVWSKEKDPILYNTKDIKCLALNIYFEAGTESKLSKIAVAQVTINRVKVGYWGDTICDVVHAPHQFSWTNRNNLIIDTDSENYKESMEVARTLLKKKLQFTDLKRALFYHADYVKPKWIDANEKVGKYGKHIYYNGAKGSWVSL